MSRHCSKIALILSFSHKPTHCCNSFQITVRGSTCNRTRIVGLLNIISSSSLSLTLIIVGLLTSTSLLPRHIENLMNDKNPPLFGVSSFYIFLKRRNTGSTVGQIVTVPAPWRLKSDAALALWSSKPSRFQFSHGTQEIVRQFATPQERSRDENASHTKIRE